MTAPSRATRAGQAYLDLRVKARNGRRPVDELLQFYVLESFLARLADSRYADQLILKGGVLLAAFGERRPTRDIDLQAHTLDNDVETVRVVICEVAARRLDDGVSFDVADATAAVIRDEDAYRGVRVTMKAELATARPHQGRLWIGGHSHRSCGRCRWHPGSLRFDHPSRGSQGFSRLVRGPPGAPEPDRPLIRTAILHPTAVFCDRGQMDCTTTGPRIHQTWGPLRPREDRKGPYPAIALANCAA